MLKINQYFDGQVASIAFQTETPSTTSATIGVMDIGEYQFDTSQHEVVTVISGQLTVKLPDEQEWRDYRDGHSFEVAAGKVFDLKVPIQTAYLCTYS